MSKAQNNDLHLISPIPKVSKLLKFCYFMLAFLLLACGNEKTKKAVRQVAKNLNYQPNHLAFGISSSLF